MNLWLDACGSLIWVEIFLHYLYRNISSELFWSKALKFESVYGGASYLPSWIGYEEYVFETSDYSILPNNRSSWSIRDVPGSEMYYLTAEILCNCLRIEWRLRVRIETDVRVSNIFLINHSGSRVPFQLKIDYFLRFSYPTPSLLRWRQHLSF